MNTQEIARRDGMHWGENATSTYFEPAARDMESHWRTVVLPVIGDLSYETVVDIAAGRGRNTRKLLNRAKRVYSVDINPENIEFMRREFADDPRVMVMATDGLSLRDIESGSVDLAYSFDSMVHFDVLVVAAYIEECFRVLRPGGHAFIHFSNYSESPGADFKSNPHWRNYMTTGLFGHFCIRAGFSISYVQTMPWGGIADLDEVALLHKPTL